MKAKEVKKLLDITQPTLSKYVKIGLIKVEKINPYFYIYNDDDVYKLIGSKRTKCERINVSYARVSNKTRKNDLKEQSNRIYNYSLTNGLSISKQFEDIKSGISFDRIGLKDMLKLIVDRQIDNIVIENKDRLCRFGFEIFVELFKFYGTKILVISEEIQNKTYEQELTDDLISIIHYFSMKSYSNRRKLNKIKKELLTNSDNNKV
ncbi:MAG: IS607 family transposase [Candidatus Lokiarchaeota archaeon]|jgi:predicted site-specific integrase-resolvase|nr:IS607 family transposase [Candidatus Lokiarchaeota archaeon]